MCQKDLGKREAMTNITQARTEHQSILSRLMTGPSDSEGAMRRAENSFGLGYWAQWNLRHKRRASFEFINRIHNVYLFVLEKSVQRDLAFLETEIARGANDAVTESLAVEAQNLLARIAVNKSESLKA